MANVNNMFPSKWLRASDIQGKEPIVTISQLTTEEVEQGKDRQPVLHFQGKDKGLVLNKTNAMNIATIYGHETDSWVGKQIQLFTTFVDFQGRSVEAIRVKPQVPQAAPTQTAGTENPAPNVDEIDDSIPF